LAGRKQHFIPQGLQRGFEAKHTGLKTQVYVYHPGRPSYLASTDGVAAERHFYSNPSIDGIGSLDDQITAFESHELNLILQQLRAAENGPVDAEYAAIAIAHLTARTAHVRGTMTSLMDGALSQFRSIVADAASTRQLAGIDSKGIKSPINEMIQDELSKVGLGEFPEKFRLTLGRIVEFRLRERFDQLFHQAKDQFGSVFESFETRMAETIAKGHTKALSEMLVSQERVRVLRALDWRVICVDHDDVRFILPDCVAVATSGSGQEFRPLAMLAADDIVTIVMPISSRQLLVGGPSEFDVHEINRQFARSCFKFFISSRQNGQVDALAESIGAYADGLHIDLLNDGLEPNERPTPVAAFSGRLQIRSPTGKFGELARKAVMRIAHDAVDIPVLDAIESIVIPSKFEAALEAILKRPPTGDEVAAAAWGVAEPVKCGAQWKCKIILPRQMVEVLTNGASQEERLIAERLIRITLGRAYYIGCWARQSPAIFEHTEHSSWSQNTRKLAFNSASEYFGALAAPGEDAEPPVDNGGLQRIATTILAGLHGLVEARRRFWKHRSVDILASEVDTPLNAILVSAASFSGFAAAVESPLDEDSAPAVVLANAGLWEWALLFSKDLARHYDRRYHWASEKELDQLAGHADRILWTIGVIATPTEQGCWIDVYESQGLELINHLLRQ